MFESDIPTNHQGFVAGQIADSASQEYLGCRLLGLSHKNQLNSVTVSP
jgi:hypothetical protein